MVEKANRCVDLRREGPASKLCSSCDDGVESMRGDNNAMVMQWCITGANEGCYTRMLQRTKLQECGHEEEDKTRQTK